MVEGSSDGQVALGLVESLRRLLSDRRSLAVVTALTFVGGHPGGGGGGSSDGRGHGGQLSEY